MPHLMYIGFDNSHRLDRNIYYFRYKDTKFKLIQSALKYRSVLLTILPDSNNQVERAYELACEYLSALSWETGAMIIIGYLGGAGRKEITLRKAKCSMRGCFNEIPRSCYSVGHDILVIPEIENDKQRKALALFRHAFSDHNPDPYFSFLFYWHVLTVGKRKPCKSIGWIDASFSKRKVYVPKEDLARLHLGNRTLGNYLYQDCRNAIAHIERPTGRKRLEVDDLKDSQRINISTRIIEKFARYYIKDELGLNKKLHLVRRARGGFPTYVAEDQLRKKVYKIAYGRKSPF